MKQYYQVQSEMQETVEPTQLSQRSDSHTYTHTHSKPYNLILHIGSTFVN